MKTLPLISLITLFLGSCDIHCDECFTPPPNFAFKIMDTSSGENLLNTATYNTDTVYLYYFENEIKKEIDLEFVINFNDNKIMQANQLGWIAARDIDEFYLYLDHADTDTLYIDIREVSDKCCTWFETKLFFINNLSVQYDWNESVYIIGK